MICGQISFPLAFISQSDVSKSTFSFFHVLMPHLSADTQSIQEYHFTDPCIPFVFFSFAFPFSHKIFLLKYFLSIHSMSLHSSPVALLLFLHIQTDFHQHLLIPGSPIRFNSFHHRFQSIIRNPLQYLHSLRRYNFL